MQIKDIYELIRKFAGTSLTSKVQADILFLGELRERAKTAVVDNYVFNVTRFCSCDKACGGIFCKPLRLYTLVGIKNT